jgi:hypothetical protein
MVSYSFLFNMMIHSSPVWAEKKETTAIGTAPVYMCNCIRGGGYEMPEKDSLVFHAGAGVLGSTT